MGVVRWDEYIGYNFLIMYNMGRYSKRFIDMCICKYVWNIHKYKLKSQENFKWYKLIKNVKTSKDLLYIHNDV